ncbi:MAG: NACHT domain-containing protein [Lachnospiraceae bacterium]|nr:NACHT domain-containing protein [Lachnospiraceae bacterium]
MDKKNNAGAIASNAGDDFHLIWGCKKLLDTLKPNSELTAISVEGPTWADSVQIVDEQKLYSIDLAEYYGGIDFERAEHVIFSQLKYSAYQMDKPWTAAGLCTKTSTTTDNSIIRRLADTYAGFNAKFDNTSEKLTLKLVSNRKLHVDFLANISEAVLKLKEKKYKRTGDLMKSVSPKCRDDIEKLYKASSLTSVVFTKFLLALNFDDCGTDIRSIHRAEIIKQLGKWGAGNLRGRYDGLIKHTKEMMLPESPIGFPMDKEYVLAALDTSSSEVFPAPAIIEATSNGYIKRDLKNVILDCINENQKKAICIQATAGIGKTTFVSHIEDMLPKESVAILYDCYGGGAFLQESERRHLIEVAIPQICNTLATECGTEWIIGKPTHEYEYWRLLEQRLKDAVVYVKEQNPKAVVAIIIDAADNSMIASDLFKEECFLKGLLRESLPDGVFLIITTRTERVPLIPFTSEVLPISLPAFNLGESSQHIHSVFINATDKQCEEFHLLTYGNPRLQTYLLAGATSVNDMLLQIKPNGKTMESLFNGFVDAVKAEYDKLVDTDILFSALVNLPRPTPIKVLCELLSLNQDALLSISVECHNGFYMDNANIFLKDEDFETYLRIRYGNNEKTIRIIADYMYDKRTTCSYCARYLHIFIDKANEFDRLIQIALDERIDHADIGLVQANQVMKNRIQLALKRPEMTVAQNHLLACKLVYRLIDYNAREDALNEFLTNAPDETVVYCDEMSVYNVFHTEFNDFDSLGRSALVFSHLFSYHVDARQYIKSYLAATKLYYNKPEDARGCHTRPNTSNIINIAEAMLRLGEREKAVNWLCNWSPKKVEAKHVYRIMHKLLKYEYTELCGALLSQRWTSPNKLAIVSAYISLGKEPPKTYVDYLLKLFKKINSIPESRFSYKQVLLFAEYVLHIGNTESVEDLVDKFSMNTKFSRIPSLYMEEEKRDFFAALRYYALKYVCAGETVKPIDLWDDKGKLASKQEAEDKKSFIKMIDFIFPIYLLRLNCIQNSPDLLNICNETLSNMERLSWNFYTYDKHQLLEAGLLIFVESISWANFTQNEFKELVSKVINVCSTAPQFKLKLLDKLTSNEYTSKAAFIILESIDSCYAKYPASAKEMSEVYLSCAQIGRRMQAELGLKYFRKAIECTKGLDYESYRKLYLYKCLANKISETKRDNLELAYRIIRLSEDFCRKMGDEKNFPYHESIGAATVLSPQSIWGSLCRLDDRDDHNGFSLQDTVPVVLTTLLNAERISLEDTVALMGLLLPDVSSQYNELEDIILKKMIKIIPSRQKPMLAILIHDVLYHIPMDEKQYRSKCIVEYLDTNVLSPELNTDKIKSMQSFLQQTQVEKQYRFAPTKELEKNIDIKKHVSESNILSQQILQDRLNPLTTADRELFVTEWLESLLPDQYVISLTWLLEIIANDFHHYGSNQILKNIATFVDSIKEWPSIETWRNDSSVQRHFLKLFAKELLHLYDDYEDIYNALLVIFPVNSQVQYEVFLYYVANHIELYDEQLVKTICRMSVVLSSEEALDLLDWATDIEMVHVHPASGDGADYNIKVMETENIENGVEHFLWRLLGHKDKGVRCKSAHVLLRAAALDDFDIIRSVVQIYDNPLPIWYMDEKNYFFIESARIWYLATCLRIAKTYSKSLIPIYSFFKSIAYDEGIVHALQRRLARDICLQLAPYCDVDVIDQLLICDKCIEDNCAGGMRKYQRESTKNSKRWKFNFDTTDTLPYWYDDVAEIFACTQNEVANECDYFVAQFGVTNEQCIKWNKTFLKQEEYQNTHNDHGYIPTVETLKKYVEWHSMFYVADKYRQTRAQIVDGYRSYETWLNGYLFGVNGLWCFEFRNHIPFLPFLWDFTKTIETKPNRHYVIPEHLPNSIIDNPVGLALDVKYAAHFQQSNRYIRIESAFVKKNCVNKLVAELKKPNVALFDFYPENDAYGYRKGPVVFAYPTCDVITTFSDNALDKKDLLLKDYLTASNYLMGPSDYLLKYLNLSQEDQLLYASVDSDINCPIQLYHWSEPEAESGYEKHSTYGHMVVIKKECLLEILKKNNQAIVFEVSISFEDDNYRFYGTPSKPAKSTTILSLEIDEKNNKLIWDEQIFPEYDN